MPIALVASLINPHSLEPLQPSSARRSFFHSVTGITYSPPVLFDPDSVRAANVRCPFCVNLTEIRTDYWTASGTGWAQPNFKGACPVCHRDFTKEVLGIRKFCDDLAWKRAGGTIFFSYEAVVPTSDPPFDPLICSETLLDPSTGVENKDEATKYMQSLMKVGVRGPRLIVLLSQP